MLFYHLQLRDYYQAGGKRRFSLSDLGSGAADTRILLHPSEGRSRREWRSAELRAHLLAQSPQFGGRFRCEKWTNEIRDPGSRWLHTEAESHCERRGQRSQCLKEMEEMCTRHAQRHSHTHLHWRFCLLSNPVTALHIARSVHSRQR